ncbi:thioesterase [Bengtsoniella intestinalis]|uniref:acyl-[acyl-carrier-protein] thioesterase n=1 Tax=Bengtsoniella intestinalis TaxID=3073143 RepID=UPI00391FB936
MNRPLPSRDQWLTPEGYARQEQLLFGQCDVYLRARPATLLKQFAAIGGHHCDAVGISYQSLLDQDQAFLLSRVIIHIHQTPMSGEMLTLHTWIDGTKGPYFQRVVQWKNSADMVVASGRSDWILVSPSNRKIYRPNTVKESNPLFFSTCDAALDCPPCQKLTLPKDGTTVIGEHQVRWSELDGNGHLHSGNYGDIVWDYLPQPYQSRPVKTFAINYNKEAPLGQTITLTGCAMDDNHYRMEGRTDHGVCFESDIVFG